METVRKYGLNPYRIGLLHGGPGAAGELKPVAENLSSDLGILEFLQTRKSVVGQIQELRNQVVLNADLPITLIGYSWGAWLGFLFAGIYPEMIRKLILVSAGAFEDKYNKDLMNVRLSRLDPKDRKEAESLITLINAGDADSKTLKNFGRLMTLADSFDLISDDHTSIDVDMNIYQSVWEEASRLRETNELIYCADNIKCPVVAINGEDDPHPIDGVEKPLSARLDEFKMIRLKNCGHIPWRERQAKDNFFKVLIKELE